MEKVKIKFFNRSICVIVFLLFFISETNFAFFNSQLMRRRSLVSLEVPIELIDTGIASSTSAYTFENSRTSLDTNDYDGTVTYSFEIIAQSSDSSSRTVNLLDSSNTVVASISVPTSATNYTRYRTTFTPTTGASNYRVQMPAATADYDINVSSARILVTQVNATKTKLYYPLLSDSTPTNINTTEVDIDNRTSTAWAISAATSNLWLKDNSNLSSISAGSSWTLEAIMSTVSGGTANVALVQAGTSTVVTGSTASTTNTTPTMISASFANNATNFTDDSQFQINISNSSGSKTAYIYKAGIWVKLTNLSKGTVLYRVSRAKSASAGTTVYRAESRAYMSTAAFKKPKFYYEDTSQCSIASCATTALYDNGTNDSGTSSPTLVTSSSNSPGISFARTRSGQITLTSGNRFFSGYVRSAGTYKIVSGFIVVTFSN